LERGLLALGLPSQTIARNTRGCGDCGHCGSGCRIGAKQSTLRTYLVAAGDGGAEIVTGCSADRIQVKQGAVEGVIAQVEGGAVMVRAPMVALAAGALHSPAILLRSGLASEQAGRNLHLHPTGVVAGRYAEPTPGWVGVPQSVMGDAFADLSPGGDGAPGQGDGRERPHAPGRRGAGGGNAAHAAGHRYAGWLRSHAAGDRAARPGPECGRTVQRPPDVDLPYRQGSPILCGRSQPRRLGGEGAARY